MDEGLWEAGVRLHIALRSLLTYANSIPPQEQTVIPSLAVSASTAQGAPPFARTCQAAHLLSRVLAHINEKHAEMRIFYEAGIQLHGVLKFFCAALSEEMETGDTNQFISLTTAAGMCYSARLTLYDCHSCAEADDPSGVGIPEQLKMQEIALAGLKELGLIVVKFASKLMNLMQTRGILTVSPLVADCLYQTAKQHLWYIRETGKTEMLSQVQPLTGALTGLGQTWSVASE
jgi:hypothetical protein